jgi:hypothetical protein
MGFALLVAPIAVIFADLIWRKPRRDRGYAPSGVGLHGCR